MPEVGLVPFARVALDVARAVLPLYRAPRSKHLFTQPQLVASCCLMRYEDWTYREAEVRLGEHRELRRALRLQRVPDYSTRCRFVARLEPEASARVLAEVVRRLGPPRPPPGRGGRAGRRIAIDATGWAPGRGQYLLRPPAQRVYRAAAGREPWAQGGDRGGHRTATHPSAGSLSVARDGDPAPALLTGHPAAGGRGTPGARRR